MFLDPDGSGGDIFGVIVEHPTGVEFGTQCRGVLTEERYSEGYFVPLSGLLFDADEGRLDVGVLRSVFHAGGACLHGSLEFDIRKRADALRCAVSKIAFWYEEPLGETRRQRLQLDDSRLSDAVEGWVPVRTPLGAGVLVWPNCD